MRENRAVLKQRLAARDKANGSSAHGLARQLVYDPLRVKRQGFLKARRRDVFTPIVESAFGSLVKACRRR
jgi:hypothetical protein